jgi:WD40 repeat protein
MASASWDCSVNIWDPYTSSSIQIYRGHSNWVYTIDEINITTIVSGSWDETIRIWKISTGETLRIINAGKLVNYLKVLSNRFQQQIVGGLVGSNKNLQIFNYSASEKTLNGHSGTVNTLEILNEAFMASGSDDKKIIIWDLSSKSIKANLTGHLYRVLCLKRLSTSLIASGDSNGAIIIWDWSKVTRVFTLIGHTSSVTSLDLYDEQTLISGSWDENIKFWNITNGQLIQSLNANVDINALAMINKSED